MKIVKRVSIIVPNYNYCECLNQRFESILSQTYNDYEIIFLDDASTDESVSLVKEKFGKNISRFEINSENSGSPFVQWNKGARLSESEYIWIAEADDTCAPNLLERAIELMDHHPNIGLTYFNTVPIDIDGKILDGSFYQNYVSDLDNEHWLRDFIASGESEVRLYLAKKNTITNVSGVVFRREAFVQAGYAPENFRMCGDWITYCRVLSHADIAFISEPLNFHRQHPARHTRNSVINLTYFREFLQVQNEISSTFNLDKKEKQDAFQRFLKEWDRLSVSSYGRISLANTLELARMTSASYPGVMNYVTIAKHLTLNGFKSLLSKWLTS